MRKLRALLSAGVMIALVALPIAAKAEPIVVTGGFLSSEGVSDFGRFHLTGAGLDITGSTQLGNVGPSQPCTLCTAGDVVDMSAEFVGELGKRGPFLVDGSPVTVRTEGFWRFTSDSIVIPGVPEDFSVRQPFTFSGSLVGVGEDGQGYVFERTLLGTGHVTANFQYFPHFDDPTPFLFLDIRYEFAETAPIPEPATLLLVGSGLAGIACRYRTRRRSHGT